MSFTLDIEKTGLAIVVTPVFPGTVPSYTITLNNSEGTEEASSTNTPLETVVSASGVYKAIVTTSTDVVIQFVLLEAQEFELNGFIITLVQQLLPPNISIDYGLFHNLRGKWLTMLSPNFNPPIDPSTPEEEINFLYKYLIAHLISRDLILVWAKQYLTSAAYSMVVGSSSGTSGNTVKKVITGPLETEYFGEDGNEVIISYLKDAFVPGGSFETISSAGCGLASHLSIYLSHCPISSSPTIKPRVIHFS